MADTLSLRSIDWRPTSTRGVAQSIRARHRSRPHVARKLYHMAMGLLCFSLYAFFLTQYQALVLLASLGGLWVLFDCLRLTFPTLNRAALNIFGQMMRREELKSISANSYYILGITLSTLFFPKNVTLLAVLFLAVGDPVAALVGSAWGKHRLWGGKKSVEGIMANAIISSVLSLGMALLYFQLPTASALLFAVLGGMISTIAEGLPLPVDDNLSIPCISAVLLSALNLVLPFA